MAENALTKVARIAAGSAMGAILKDKDGNDKIVKPDGDANYLDLRDIVAGGSGTGGGDNPENPDNPSAGADYYAGSLADGEITERNLEWSGTDDPTKDLTVTLNDDPGTKIFGQYDGITILGHIQKIALDKGVVGDTSEVDLNYDSKNTKKDGYYTTTAPYPIYIKTESLPAGQTANVPINGVGEGLDNSNEKSPELNLTFNSDKTLTINHVMGYSNDGDSAGATGFNYYFVVDKLATFSTQPAVAQLPPSVNLFSGLASGDVVTVGPSSFYENVMDGLEVTFDDYATISSNKKVAISSLKIDKKFKIPKEKLIIGNTINFPMNFLDYADSSNMGQVISAITGKPLYNKITVLETDNGSSYYNDPHTYYAIDAGIFNVTVSEGKINVMCTKSLGQPSSTWLKYTAKLNVNKVTTYKD